MVQCLYCDTTCNDHNDDCPNYTPPMPKVKDPKPEDARQDRCHCDNPASSMRCDKCFGFLDQSTISDTEQSVKPEDAYTMPPLPRKEVISVQPGDKIALMVPGTLSTAAYRGVGKQMSEAFPGTKCIILEEGMTLEVYREQESNLSPEVKP